MNCPSCSSALSGIKHEGVSLDFCSVCKGLWFDAGEVSSYFELSQDLPTLSGVSRQEQPSGMNCPRCSNAMTQMLYAPPNELTIDRCSSCGGMWFDKGQVQVLHKLSATLEEPKSRFAGVASALDAQGYQIVGYKTD